MQAPNLPVALQAAFDAAAHDPAAWEALCDALTVAFGGVGTLIVPTDKERRFPWVTGSRCLEAVLTQYLAEGWHERDLRELALPHGRVRGYLLDSDVGTPEELEALPYYRDLLRPNGLGGFVGILFDVGGTEWSASVQLPLGMHAPAPEAIALVPAISEALHIAAQAAAARIEAHWAEVFAGLAHLERGVVLFDGAGRECRRSPGADSILARCNPEEFPGPTTRHYLAKLTESQTGRGFRPQPFVVASGAQASVFGLLERVPESLRLFSTEAVSVITLSERTSVEDDIARILSIDFSLLPSEIALALALCRGMMIKEAAVALGIAEGTARQRLKMIYQKTDTKAQHQLVAKVMQVRGLLPDR